MLQYNNNKNEEFFMYDYIEHLKKFRFEWIQNDLGLKYRIKIDNSDSKKIKKQLTLSRSTRKKICLHESRIWNMKMTWKNNESALDKSRLSFLVGYLYDEKMLKSLIGITTPSFDFTSLTPEITTSVLQRVTLKTHSGRPANESNTDIFYLTKKNLSFTVLVLINIIILRVTERIQRLLLPKFYHDRKDTNFLKGLKYFGEKPEIDEKYFYEAPLLGRKLYEYRVDPNDNKRASFNPKELDWPFPEQKL